MQRFTEDELRERGTAIAARITDAPQSSGFLWHLTEKTSNTNLYLLGTVHARALASLVKRKGLVTGGDERTLMEVYAGHLKQGLDPQDAEARNQRWATGVVPGVYHPGQTVLLGRRGKPRGRLDGRALEPRVDRKGENALRWPPPLQGFFGWS